MATPTGALDRAANARIADAIESVGTDLTSDDR